jgi:hypothetical protein
VSKIIINLGVAAFEQSNVVGERFSADDSRFNLFIQLRTNKSPISTHRYLVFSLQLYNIPYNTPFNSDEA